MSSSVTAGVSLADAAREQMETLGYASGYAGSSNPRAIEVAERLGQLTYPKINRFFFTSGGAEANESAIKVARSYWKLRGRPAKTKVISRELGYHGTTLAAMSATGIAGYWAAVRTSSPGLHSRCAVVAQRARGGHRPRGR
jgi:adenosylmethionine-8-amino-7-oxononanoate aminotransferase